MGKARHRVAGILAAIFLLAVFPSSAADKTWTGAVSTDWFEPNNWDPPGVPAGDDSALILTNGAVLSADVFVHHLILGKNTSISGPGNLTPTNLICTHARLDGGGGSLLVPAGGSMRVEGDRSTDLFRDLYNHGHVTITDSNAYVFVPAHINNHGTFEVQGDRAVSGHPQFSFYNTGLFLKSGGQGTNSFGMRFINTGEMRLLSGTLTSAFGHTNDGVVNVSAGAVLELASNRTLISPQSLLQGFGTIRFPGSLIEVVVLTTNEIQPRIEIIDHEYPFYGRQLVKFDSNILIRDCLLDGGRLDGTSTVTIANFQWSKGLLTGSGTFVIPPNGSFVVTGTAPKRVEATRTIINYGTAEWRDSGTIEYQWQFQNFTFLNRGTFRVTGDGSWGPPIINEGVLIRASGNGGCAMSITTNWGRIEVRSGRLAADNVRQLGGEIYLNGGDLFTSYGGWRILQGVLRGSGAISQYPPGNCDYWGFSSGAGDVYPGNPIGILLFDCNANVAGTRFHIDIAGTNAGVDHDQVVFAGQTWIQGQATLNIVITNGFQPLLGDRFEVVRFSNTTRCQPGSGNFPLLSGTDLGNGLVLIPEYSPTNIVLVVTNMPAQRFYVTKAGCKSAFEQAWLAV